MSRLDGLRRAAARAAPAAGRLARRLGPRLERLAGRARAWTRRLAGRLPAPARAWAAALGARLDAAGPGARRAAAGGAGLAALALLLLSLGGGGERALTFEARRGDLEITVLEGGSLEALRSQEIRSRIKGREGVKILSIVEEGYQITPEDVAAGLVLVELDTAQLIDQRLNQEIAVETAEASYIERRAQYEIQLNENMTALNDARQDMRFARLDFEKFLGGAVVAEILDGLDIDGRLARAERLEAAPPPPAAAPEPEPAAAPPEGPRAAGMRMGRAGGGPPPELLRGREGRFAAGARGRGPGRPAGAREAAAAPEPPVLTLSEPAAPPPAGGAALLMDEEYMAARAGVDFGRYADIDRLEDGEAKQRLRALLDELQVAQEERLLAQDRIEGQRRLEARGFVTPTELEAEELKLSKARNKQAEKETALRLYIRYSFPKEAEEKLSDYENAVMGYLRQLKENVAERAQEEARFSSAERKYNLERVKLRDVNQQLEWATIRAERPGLVVYGAADQNRSRFRGGSEEAVQEGATVRERQAILTIPDLRRMAVKANIHESAVQRVAPGQRARIAVDAFPDERLAGTVSKVAVVADSANAFLNPDLKVYPATITIDGSHGWLRPGMSAEVEILVDRLEDVVYVPVQAVRRAGDRRVVYVAGGGRPERREVEVGAFSDSFIEIVSGLREGEPVLLLPPRDAAEG